MIIHNTEEFIFKFSEAERSCTINSLLLHKITVLDMKITVTTIYTVTAIGNSANWRNKNLTG